MNERVVILITGRLKSTRLKRKALLEIEGRPMFAHMIDRLKRAKVPAEIVLCTSTIEQDDPLEELALKEGIQCFRGHPDDVLVRLLGAAQKFNADHVINCMADNPLTDPEYIDRLAEYHLEGGFDYTRTEGLPLGLFSYAMKTKALEAVCDLKDDEDTEIWGEYFTITGRFECGVLEVDDPEVIFPELRLTVDTAQDFELMSRVIGSLKDEDAFEIRKIVKFCRDNPELLELNQDVIQKKGHAVKLKEDRL
ncbi:NTP transferase domain-containing protein [Akkermansiaceae bacterium]|nr:NTP transferase domain-containing protein [Akkermansiaceae bacterium]MDB4311130.1 NTP transferase domain-containing protein [bacterium]MDB4320410.1 NTP transferase domain-containing protein [Akkermansiaceae bacterium]MDB4596914.1 NTP transferase domain-containing protein [Akkermansiaceae bacterium]MDB4769776.1 NTP transferase domain-containing protein [bacterium]